MPDPIEMCKARLAHVITVLETLVGANDGHISGRAIGNLREALVEVNAELYLLGDEVGHG